MKLIDIILQGPMHTYTAKIADMYTTLPFVNNVIISCWDTCPDIDGTMISWENPRIYVLKNKDVEYAGSWNRNRLIKSSYEGLKCVVTDYCIKMRTDQIVSNDSMMMMYYYYFDKCNINLSFRNDNSLPHSKIGIMGICKDFPYHPVDHILWGHKEDLLTFFNIDYDTSWYDEESIGKSYGEIYTRSEIYITAPYISKFSLEAEIHKNNPDIYLKDNSPKIHEALDLSYTLMEQIFLLFPMIQMQWPKNGMQQYHYDVMSTAQGGHMYWG